MPPPPNLSPATAIVIPAVPYSTTQTVAFGGTVYSVWYQFTAPDSYVYGVKAYGDFATCFFETEVYTLVGGAPVGYLSLDTNDKDDTPVYFPVTAGVTYYLKFQEDDSVPPALLTLTLQRAPEAPSAPGDLLVPDEIVGFPAAVIVPGTGAVRAYLSTLPDSVSGDTRADGVFLVDNRTLHHLELFNRDFTRRTTVPFHWTGAYPLIRTCWPSGIFYVCNRVAEAPGPSEVPIIQTVAPDGTLGPTTWTLPQPGLVAMAPSNDATLLYHAGQGTDVFADGAPVQRYHLDTASLGTDLAPGVPNYAPRSLLVLADDTILVLYGKRTEPIDAVVRRYDAAGTLLTTYPLGEVGVTGFASNYLFRSLAADGTSFWVRSHPRVAGSFNTSRHTRIRVSDGAVLAMGDTPEFLGGVMQGNADASSDLFGNSPSCPVLLVMAAPAPLPPIPPGRIRRVRRAPHLSAEQVEQFFARFQLELEAGVGNATDPGADPQVFLRWSDDGGHTWRPPIAVSAGMQGAFRRRALWRRLGRSRDRVFEVSMSDPVKWALRAASLDAQKGTS